MNEGTAIERPGRPEDASASDTAPAWGMLGAGSREKADAFLEKQARLVDLQAEELRRELHLRHWSLRMRHISDIMKVTFEIGLAFIVIAIVACIAAAMWSASRAEGLVVHSFSVPPEYVQAGISGTVMADDMTEKIAAIRDFANENSLAHSKDVREAREDVKVEIPETGISISEAWRYLRLWLGAEQHLNGNLRVLPDGKIALTVSLGGSDTFTFTGKSGELDSLEQKAAERIFETAEPVDYVLYLWGKNRAAESLEWAERNLSLWSDNRNLAEAYTLYAEITRVATGEVRLALARTNVAIALDPGSMPPHMHRLMASRDLGHDEDVLEQARVIAGLRQEDNVVSFQTGQGFPWAQELGAISRAAERGDFAKLSTQPCIVYCSLTSALLLHAEGFAHLYDARRASGLVDQAQSLGATDPADLARTQYFIHAATADWRASVVDARRLADALLADKSYGASLKTLRVQTQALPLLAHALAASGDHVAAHRSIDGTPLDCYACVRERGNVDGFERNWAGAAYWFADAVRLAPSIPFAYADWGEILLHEGRYDAAIEKFHEANLNGPHFADPLELWGEALMQKNRSDLALTKFEEANKYAPDWGRLHLEWGKALTYLGKRNDASDQFAIASHLDLSAADAVDLKRVRGSHV